MLQVIGDLDGLDWDIDGSRTPVTACGGDAEASVRQGEIDGC